MKMMTASTAVSKNLLTVKEGNEHVMHDFSIDFLNVSRPLCFE